MARQFTRDEVAEIRSMYRSAKNQKAQIGILAQLYLCEKDEIMEVLKSSGEKLPEMVAGKKMETDRKKRIVRSYDRAVRDQAVKAVLLDGMTQTAAAERFGVTLTTLSTWVQQAKKKREEFLGYEPEKTETKKDSGRRRERENPAQRLGELRLLLEELPEELLPRAQARELERVLDKAEGYLVGIAQAGKRDRNEN